MSAWVSRAVKHVPNSRRPDPASSTWSTLRDARKGNQRRIVPACSARRSSPSQPRSSSLPLIRHSHLVVSSFMLILSRRGSSSKVAASQDPNFCADSQLIALFCSRFCGGDCSCSCLQLAIPFPSIFDIPKQTREFPKVAVKFGPRGAVVDPEHLKVGFEGELIGRPSALAPAVCRSYTRTSHKWP